MTRRTCHFSGQVQGVGFRYTCQAIARGFPVGGYVQNLSDGRVLLVAEGAEEEIDRFLEAVQRQMAGHVRDLDCTSSDATGQFKGFTIRL